MLATTTTAVVAVLLAGTVALGLTRTAYDASARTVLHREALLIARLADSPAGRPGRPLREALRNSRIRVIRVPTDGTVPAGSLLAGPGLAVGSLRRAAAAGSSVQQTLDVNGQRYLSDTEPVVTGAGGAAGGVVLLQRLTDARAVGDGAARDLARAAALGLVVAIALGFGLSRRLTRPLVRAAAAARQLAAGRRDIRLDTAGPAEVAAVSTSLNTVAETLTRTEVREREFLLSISHELRTPLTAIRGFSEAIADRVAVGEEAVAAGATILAEAERMTHLVADLLALARSGTADFTISVAEVDLVGLVAATARAWRERAGTRGVRLVLDPPPGPVVVATDELRVRQILDALVDNAVRATPDGGVVVLGLGPSAAGAVLSVRDNGPGLTAADYPVAFQRGVLHEKYRGIRPGGTGLGLALVGNLAARLGGVATAGPAPEGGAAFTVRLPSTRAGASSQGASGASPLIPGSSSSRRTSRWSRES